MIAALVIVSMGQSDSSRPAVSVVADLLRTMERQTMDADA